MAWMPPSCCWNALSYEGRGRAGVGSAQETLRHHRCRRVPHSARCGGNLPRELVVHIMHGARRGGPGAAGTGTPFGSAPTRHRPAAESGRLGDDHDRAAPTGAGLADSSWHLPGGPACRWISSCSISGRHGPRRRSRPGPSRTDHAPVHAKLGREIEVLQLLARGLSNREIAERLVISRKTAGHHVEHIYAKTGTTNRALASLFAASHGLITDPAAEPGADVTQGPAGNRSTRPASR